MSYNRKFNEECLTAHNAFRSMHNAPDLRLNPDLAIAAQTWAQKLAESGRLQHCPDCDHGENLAVRWTSTKADFNGQQVSEQWYNEILNYDFDQENQLNCGHFSQLVWRSTKEAGFGKAVASSGKIYVVGRYHPPGNFINEWKKNVLPPVAGDDFSQTEETVTLDDLLPSIDLEFNRQCIISHNEYREKHDAAPLEIDEELAQSAQSWANELAQIGALEHSPESEGKVGENVGMKWSTRGSDINGSKATQQWYAEGKNYDYTKENQLNCGHFSQVVWRSTKRAGFGKAVASDGKVFVVGQYHPPGNYRGRWRENVRPPKGHHVENSLQLPKESDRDRSPRREPKSFSAENLELFNEDCLETHNQLRSKHHAPHLRLSSRLMTSAQKWAEHLAMMGYLQHSPESGSKIGENVGMKWSSRGADINGEQATNQWYSEVKNYDFSRENQLNCGHFSQVVWCGTKEVGFGKMRSDSGKIFVVAHYLPPGNYRDQWRKNVLPIQGDHDRASKYKDTHLKVEHDADFRRTPSPRTAFPSSKPWEDKHRNASLDSDYRRSSSPSSKPWEDKHHNADLDSDYRRSSSPSSKPWEDKHRNADLNSDYRRSSSPSSKPWEDKHHNASLDSGFRPINRPGQDGQNGLADEERPIEMKRTRAVHAELRAPTNEEETKSKDQTEGSMATRSRYMRENGEAHEETITAKHAAKIERSPTPTHPDDKYFFGPREKKDLMLSRKLMRRYIDANKVLLTTAEVFERPNKSRYVIIGAAREVVTGEAVY